MKKDFDCVQMKHDIQQKLMKEFEGLTLEERKKIIADRIAADPILGPLWKNSPRIRTAGLVTTESFATPEKTEK